MTPANVYTCPITGCTWQHEGKPLDLPENVTNEQLADLGREYTNDIERTMTAHFTNDHTVIEWVNEVAALRAALMQEPQPLLCFGCYVDRYKAEQAGQPLPPQNHVQLITPGGAGQCLNHVKLQNGPVVPGRTPGGIILGNGQLPPDMN